MPKIKTHSGAKKRFKKKSNKIISHRMCNRSHINFKMSSKRKRRLNKSGLVCKEDKFRILKAI